MTAAPLKRGTLSFDGSATTGDFTGTTTTVRGDMTGESLSQVRGWVEAPVNTLVTGNGRRDRDLNKSMESDKFPTIRFELADLRTEWERGDSVGVVLVGKYLIHGVERQVEQPAVAIFQSDGVRVTSTTPMNLKDYQIGGLSKFLGVLKMNPAITVHIDLLFGH